MRPPPPTPPLPGLDWTGAPPGKGHRYARVPLPALDAIPRGTTRDVFQVLAVHHRPGRPIRLTNEAIARQARCDEGSARRALAWLKSHPIPDDPEGRTFILVGGNNEDRVIWLQCRPLEAGESGSDASHKSDRARAGAQGGRAPARAPLGASPCPETPAVLPSFRNSKELNNVNVVFLPEESLAHAGTRPDAGPVEVPDPTAPPAVPAPDPPAAAPPADGVDPELAGLTADGLRERIAALKAEAAAIRAEGLRRPGNAERLVRVSSRIGAARNLLEARERPQGPPPTPKVGSLDPRPAVAPAATPGPPKPPSLKVLAERLPVTAGPGPVEEFVKQLAAEVGDDHSDGYFRRLAGRVRRKEVDPKRVLEGVRRGRNAEARCRGAIFVAYVERRE